MFSNEELFKLRNNIPVDALLKHFNIPTKLSEGFLRFLCPVCSDLNTAINKKTNLARCFLCEKNFNTIDLTMAVRSINFKEAVVYLQSMMRKKNLTQKPENDTAISEILLNCINNRNRPSSTPDYPQKQIADLERKIDYLEKEILTIKRCLSKSAG